MTKITFSIYRLIDSLNSAKYKALGIRILVTNQYQDMSIKIQDLFVYQDIK